MRDPESLSVPPSRLALTADSVSGVTIAMLAAELAQEDLRGYVERDHLARRPLDVIEMAEVVQESLSQRLHLLGPLREDPSPWYRPGDTGSGITTLGRKGEYTVVYLDEHGDDPIVCPLHLESDDSQSSSEVVASQEMPLISAVHYWLARAGNR